MTTSPTAKAEDFFALTPEPMLDAVEAALGPGHRATGRTLQLNSMENRVYEIELEGPAGNGGGEAESQTRRVVAKFYRPGRWSRDTILDEHRFVQELAENEVPAIAPLTLTTGLTLTMSSDGIMFAVFPKTQGRILQELDDLQLAQIGRLLGRLHNVGARIKAHHRVELTPATYGKHSLDTIEASGLMDTKVAPRYQRAVTQILHAVGPMLAHAPHLRIHGDCHLGNVLWQHTGPFFLDFDDMVMGPAVQDVWMIVRGRGEEADRQREVLLHGYEQMREFDRAQLRLVEPLRALRMIHYSAWIASHWADPSFQRTFPDFGTYQYWFDAVNDLDEQLALVTTPTAY